MGAVVPRYKHILECMQPFDCSSVLAGLTDLAANNDFQLDQRR
jgi:hypothetical protein